MDPDQGKGWIISGKQPWPSMGANLWGESPLWEYRLGLIVSKDNHEPKARARPRGIVRRKPECKRCETTNRNRIQGRGMRGELAHDSKAHRYAAYGKCGACAPTVRVLTWGDLRSMAARYLMAISAGSCRTRNEPGAGMVVSDPTASEATQTHRDRAARPAVMHRVRPQKSAEAIVGGQESGRRRAEQHRHKEQTR